MRYFYVYLKPCLNVYALEPGLPLLVRGMRFDSLVPVEAWGTFYRDRIAAEGRIPLKPGEIICPRCWGEVIVVPEGAYMCRCLVLAGESFQVSGRSWGELQEAWDREVGRSFPWEDVEVGLESGEFNAVARGWTQERSAELRK
jgi:hypothetical protein